jgi:hypothetical protein
MGSFNVRITGLKLCFKTRTCISSECFGWIARSQCIVWENFSTSAPKYAGSKKNKTLVLTYWGFFKLWIYTTVINHPWSPIQISILLPAAQNAKMYPVFTTALSVHKCGALAFGTPFSLAEPMQVTSTNLLLIGRLVAGTVAFAGSHLTICGLENWSWVVFLSTERAQLTRGEVSRSPASWNVSGEGLEWCSDRVAPAKMRGHCFPASRLLPF